MMQEFTLSGNIVDVVHKRIYKGTLHINNGIIDRIEPHSKDAAGIAEKGDMSDESSRADRYILPGLIDAHVHVESSMLVPSAFASLAVVHGTTGTISDPHEIANVLGMEGVRFMIENGKSVPFHFCFGAPSCVPATPFESSGASISADEVQELIQLDEVKYLSEMMNFPGVIHDDEAVMKKIQYARDAHKVIDGHAPLVSGDDLRKYIQSGISTDHECTSIEEAREKLALGMKILIRESKVEKNLDELMPLIKSHPESVMLCSDDANPSELIHGHINLTIKKAVEKGYDLFDVLRAATLNPVKHYSLDNGLLQTGDSADMVVIDNLEDFGVLQTYVQGVKVAENGESLIRPVHASTPNRFHCDEITPDKLAVPARKGNIRVIQATDGALITKSITAQPTEKNGFVVPDVEKDLLKVVVVNRYTRADPAVAFIRGFGLLKGAIASSIAHDSHNIIAVGTSDQELSKAINLIIQNKGGIAYADHQEQDILPLPVAGLMTNSDGHKVAETYNRIEEKAKQSGKNALQTPFMTLSFMALLVIPELKISDKGLFDGTRFQFTSLFTET